MPYAAPSANLTAVCVVGEQRTFLEPVVQLGFARRLHRPGYGMRGSEPPSLLSVLSMRALCAALLL